MSDALACAGCGKAIAFISEPNHAKVTAMQWHDRACIAHSFDAPCRHNGPCYHPTTREIA